MQVGDHRRLLRATKSAVGFVLMRVPRVSAAAGVCVALTASNCSADEVIDGHTGGSTAQSGAGGQSGGLGGVLADAGAGASGDASSESDSGCSHLNPECCGAKYELGADADTAGLCDAAESIGCNCLEFHAGSVECSPDGTVCCHSVDQCNPKPQCGWVDCGQSNQRLPTCPASQVVFDSASQQGLCRPCAKDSHCASGKKCAWRLGDRMFCEP